jgi:hypothetical protein
MGFCGDVTGPDVVGDTPIGFSGLTRRTYSAALGDTVVFLCESGE